MNRAKKIAGKVRNQDRASRFVSDGSDLIIGEAAVNKAIQNMEDAMEICEQPKNRACSLARTPRKDGSP
ncbi:MAG: hypothetical protein GY869_07630 [Planctomycetes bacterium]|nr:hypothetical protein [Planctomycetota bacterium]